MKSSTLILTVIAATAVVLLANMYKDTQELQDLDCGLTTHFETFLSNHGIGLFIRQDMEISTSIGRILDVEHGEERIPTALPSKTLQ